MDPFTNLPYDKMIEICESLDDKSLGRLVRTSNMAHQTCQMILTKRRENFVEEFVENVNDISDINNFYTIYNKNNVTVKLYNNPVSNYYFIYQIIEESLGPSKIKWILPDISISEIGNQRFARIRKSDINELKQLGYNLHDQGYKHIK